MIDYNEVTIRKHIIVDGEPYEVLASRVFRMQQRKPVNQTKLKNLITGKVAEHTFHQSDKVEEAELNTKEVKYLFNNKGTWWFCPPDNPSARFSLTEEAVGSGGKFIKPNTLVKIIYFEEKMIGLEIPIKVELKVTDAPPAVKGDTSKGGQKIITLET